MTLLSDEFLIAYLDGQLERGQANGVTQMASANAEIARRLMGLKRTQSYFMETFSAFARIEMPAPAAQTVPEMRTPRAANTQYGPNSAPSHGPSIGNADVRYPASASIKETVTQKRSQLLLGFAVFLGGVVGGYGANLLVAERPAPAPKMLDRQLPAITPIAVWTQDIARFHAFFPKETLTPHPDAISNAELIRFQLGKIAGKAFNPPDFTRQGYTLFRGQGFTYNQDKMMQLTYSSKTEPPLSLYVLPAPTASDSPVIVHAYGPNKAVSWVDDKVRFFLICDKNEDDLKVLSVIAQNQIPRKG